MAEQNKREIITPEALNEYMAKTYIREDLIFLYLLSTEKNKNGSIQAFCDIFNYEGSADDLEKELLKEANFDSFDMDKILEKIPNEYRESALEMGRKFIELRSNEGKINFDMWDLIKDFAEEVEQKSQDFARSLSNHDLSLIPPDMYSKIKYINLINFENTGAKLDFTELNYDQKIIGSLKGCNLLSFDFSKYSSQESEDIGLSYEIKPVLEEFLDIENYQVVIDAYRKMGYRKYT